MSDHLSADRVQATLWLIGAGPMALAYGKVLVGMEVPFEVVGRGAVSAEKFREEMDVPVHAGGVQKRLLEVPPPEVAVVAVDLPQLAVTAKALISAGTRKILLEKPGAMTLSAIHELSDFADSHAAEVYVAYNRRFNSSTKAARQMIVDDGGVRSFHFEFSEWSHKIECLAHPPEVLANWLFANSSHVIDLAFYLGGIPRELFCLQHGSLSWHPSGSVFSGSGATEAGALFSFQADWVAPGRWGVEMLTSRRRLVLRPLEQLWVQQKGTVEILQHELDDELDLAYKPGLYSEVVEFLREEPRELPRLAEHLHFAANVLQPIAGLNAGDQSPPNAN